MTAPQIADKFACLRLENQLCFPLYACAKELIRQYRLPLEALHLTYTQYVVMMALWEYGGMSERELGRIVRLDSGTLAPLLKRLEKQGYLSRVRPDSNERKLFLSLTAEGEALKDQALALPRQMRSWIDLSEEELRQLKCLLERTLIKLEEITDGKEPLV